MAEEKFKVKNAGGMWVRSEPVVSEATKKVLLPNGHLVTKLGDSPKPDWWKVKTKFEAADVEGFSNKNLMVSAPANGSAGDLMARTIAVVERLSPSAKPNYLEAIRRGAPLFEDHGITTPLRMAHFLAQAMHETGNFKILRESMDYRAPRIMEIFGVGIHSARVTAAEAPTLAHNERALSERVYGLGNPRKAPELGNTKPGDGFAFRGNGVLQTTGRGAHRRMGEACGLDFEGNPSLVTETEHALKPALQEWTDGRLNVAADANDIRKITKRINGGFNGLDERKALFAKLLPLLKGDS
ncbi:MAG: glycoside hydrolase family 19 protein [Pyrinomonadaceae bacterium]|nr:glycoside hydrolase family 19 protein [Pyrinomonadaceae bacterium]